MTTFEENVKAYFNKADKDGSGFLSALELYKVLLESGFGGTAYDVQVPIAPKTAGDLEIALKLDRPPAQVPERGERQAASAA